MNEHKRVHPSRPYNPKLLIGSRLQNDSFDNDNNNNNTGNKNMIYNSFNFGEKRKHLHNDNDTKSINVIHNSFSFGKRTQNESKYYKANNKPDTDSSSTYKGKTYQQNIKKTKSIQIMKPEFEKNESRFTKDRQITSIDDAIQELKWKQNPNIKRLDEKMYDELEKFQHIINFICTEKLDSTSKVIVFNEICKTFSIKQLTDSTNISRKSSIYSIFFDNNGFKLTDCFKQIIIESIKGKIEINEIDSIIDFFHALINVSSLNAEILNENIILLSRITEKYPSQKKKIEDLIEFSEIRKEIEINSLESSV